MQKHAVLLGLGDLDDDELADEIQSVIGDYSFRYSQPQLAGGIVVNADDYGNFLRHLLSGDLLLGQQLGTHAVCTNPATCASADYSPMYTESWHYSLGHWVEDDPVYGDGAFSSSGAFGFYPWIDASGSWYGIVARESHDSESGHPSAMCGRLIRKAWLTGVEQ
jgi:CubicO group peptidase (beta-lactamase class C family)